MGDSEEGYIKIVLEGSKETWRGSCGTKCRKQLLLHPVKDVAAEEKGGAWLESLSTGLWFFSISNILKQ